MVIKMGKIPRSIQRKMVEGVQGNPNADYITGKGGGVNRVYPQFDPVVDVVDDIGPRYKGPRY